MKMNTRDYAVSVLASLSEQKMLEFITLFADENTLARMESDMLANDPNAKKYSSFKEFMDEMEQEENA
ncbi:MAG: hypothetical protein K2H93_08150 [Oscillospiraceae bacterium]|nr:hypothetical protein [Oscillospiraceae bacterium]